MLFKHSSAVSQLWYNTASLLVLLLLQCFIEYSIHTSGETAGSAQTKRWWTFWRILWSARNYRPEQCCKELFSETPCTWFTLVPSSKQALVSFVNKRCAELCGRVAIWPCTKPNKPFAGVWFWFVTVALFGLLDKFGLKDLTLALMLIFGFVFGFFQQ